MENSSGKKQLVVNTCMRHVNRFLLRSFKHEDWRAAMMLFEQGELMFTFDLKSGYHHVEIAAQHYKYLGQEWNNRFYVFTGCHLGWQLRHMCSQSFYAHWSGCGEIGVKRLCCTQMMVCWQRMVRRKQTKPLFCTGYLSKCRLTS